MTQTEYEQKKRECWEEFCRMNPSHNKSIFAKKTLEFGFGRAYALGKQTEAITQEEIEKAAQEHADELRVSSTIPAALVPLLHDIAKSSYQQGAQDFIGKQEIKQEIKQEKDADTVIQGWVFVDETTFDRILCVRKVTQGDYEVVWDSGHPEFCLGEELFPDMVPNKLPEPVEIIIKRKKK